MKDQYSWDKIMFRGDPCTPETARAFAHMIENIAGAYIGDFAVALPEDEDESDAFLEALEIALTFPLLADDEKEAVAQYAHHCKALHELLDGVKRERLAELSRFQKEMGLRDLETQHIEIYRPMAATLLERLTQMQRQVLLTVYGWGIDEDLQVTPP